MFQISLFFAVDSMKMLYFVSRELEYAELLFRNTAEIFFSEVGCKIKVGGEN